MFVSAGDWLSLLDATACSEDVEILGKEYDGAKEAYEQAMAEAQQCRQRVEEERRKFSEAKEELLLVTTMIPTERA